MKRKKIRRLAPIFLIDFLFFTCHENKHTILPPPPTPTKMDRPQKLAQVDWLECVLAEEVSVTVLMNHLLLCTVTLGRMS